MQNHSYKNVPILTESYIHHQSDERYICLVDKDRKTGDEITKILSGYGFKVDYFVDAETALTAILKNNYCLIIMDLSASISSYSGDVLVHFIRKYNFLNNRNIPIIVLSGLNQKEKLLRAYKAGANGLLVKPLSHEKLLKRILELTPVSDDDITLLNSQKNEPAVEGIPDSVSAIGYPLGSAANENSTVKKLYTGPSKSEDLAKIPPGIVEKLRQLDKDTLIILLYRHIKNKYP